MLLCSEPVLLLLCGQCYWDFYLEFCMILCYYFERYACVLFVILCFGLSKYLLTFYLFPIYTLACFLYFHFNLPFVILCLSLLKYLLISCLFLYILWCVVCCFVP